MSSDDDRPSGPDIEHYLALDVVRVMSAIAVLFWHYQHFFMPSALTQVTAAQRALSPLYGFFKPLYDHGYIAVQIFWILSGFIFAAVYVERAATTASFFWARFARLYPLHLLTLIIVGILQYVSVAVAGHEQIYTNNNLYHFALQIFFVSEWGWQQDNSFNGPIWSVSVEILIYLAFWSVLPILRKSQSNPAIAIALFCWLLANFSPVAWHAVWACGSYFFAGAAMWRIHSKSRTSPIVISCASGVFLFWGIIILANWPNLENKIAVPLISIGLLGLALAVDRSPLHRYCEPAKPLGNLTYGVYLWHVPLQIAVLIAIQHWGASRLMYSPFFLLGFIISVLIVSVVSYRYFEKPMRLAFRRMDRAANQNTPSTSVKHRPES